MGLAYNEIIGDKIVVLMKFALLWIQIQSTNF